MLLFLFSTSGGNIYQEYIIKYNKIQSYKELITQIIL